MWQRVRSFLQIYSHLLKRSSIENFIRHYSNYQPENLIQQWSWWNKNCLNLTKVSRTSSQKSLLNLTILEILQQFRVKFLNQSISDV